MGTKNNPSKFDCYKEADPDEPIFILLARDTIAPRIIKKWTDKRIAIGKNKRDDPQIVEALKCAEAMEKWHSRISMEKK